MKIYKKIYLIVLAIFVLEFIIILTMVFLSTLSGSEELFSKNIWLLQKIVMPSFGMTILVLLILSVFFPTEYTGKMQYSNKEEQKRYEQRIAFDKPKIKEAIKNKDINFLWILAKKYIEMDYFVEEVELLDKIIELDPNGFYGKQAKKLLETADVRLKDDKGIDLTEEADKEIKELENKHWKNISSLKVTLSLAEACRRHGLIKNAILYYHEILINSKKSAEGEIAKAALSELIKDRTDIPEFINLEEESKIRNKT